MRGLFLSGLWGAIIALSTIAILPFFLSVRGVDVILPSLVLFLMVTPLSRVLVHAAVTGIILDSYALQHVYLHTPRLLLLVLIGFFISRQWLTNRSLYTAFVLVLLMTTMDRAWIGLADIFQGGGGTWKEGFYTLLLAYTVHASLVAIGFTGLAFLSKRLSSPIGRGGKADWYV